MTPVLLFIISLIAGIGCIRSGVRRKRKGKGLIIIIGAGLCLFGAFGLFTAFL